MERSLERTSHRPRFATSLIGHAWPIQQSWQGVLQVLQGAELDVCHLKWIENVHRNDTRLIGLSVVRIA